MGAPKGNEFWKLRSKHGRDKIFTTPDIMLQACYEYFEWCEKYPLIEIDFRGSKIEKIELPKMRAMTMWGLCSFLHVNTVYFNDFESGLKGKDDATSKDFSKVITHVRESITNQKFAGAAAGFLNPNIIARDLGLVEKKDMTTGGEKMPGTIINNILELSDFDTEDLKALNEIIKKKKVNQTNK